MAKAGKSGEAGRVGDVRAKLKQPAQDKKGGFVVSINGPSGLCTLKLLFDSYGRSPEEIDAAYQKWFREIVQILGPLADNPPPLATGASKED